MSEKDHKATGPITPEGKARSAQNALKHGFRSRSVIIPAGFEDEFKTLEESLRDEIKPSGQLEESVFQQLLKAAWDLRRIQNKLARLAPEGEDPFDSPDLLKQYDLFQRYHNRAELSYYRAQRELRVLQTSRVLQQTIPAPLDLGALPRLANTSHIISLAKRTHKDYNSLAINNLISTTYKPGENDPPLPRKPLSFMDLLTDKERRKFEPKI